MRGELGAVSPEAAMKAKKIPSFVNSFAKTIEKNLNENLPEVQHKSWEYLDHHKNYSILLAAAIEKLAEGKSEEAKECWEIFEKYVAKTENKYPDVLDVAIMRNTLGANFK